MITSCNYNKCQCIASDKFDNSAIQHPSSLLIEASEVANKNQLEYDWVDDSDYYDASVYYDKDYINDHDENDEEKRDQLVIDLYDLPILLVCCLFNRHNLENLLPKQVDLVKQHKYKKNEESFNSSKNGNSSANNDHSNIYYDYYYGLNPLDLDQTFLTTSTTGDSSACSEHEISEIEEGVNYLEIDDELYYEQYDLVDDYSQSDVKLMRKTNGSIKKDKDISHLKELGLSLVDLLLEHGANKYLCSKLSDNTLKYLNKKTKKCLESYFKSSFLNFDGCLATQQISPLLITLYFDDLDLFKKLYEHQRTMFDYTKPNEHAELIINAVKASSHRCLAYLLNKSSADEDIVFHVISNVNSVETIDILIRNRVDLRQLNKSENNNTIFYYLFESLTNNKSILSKILKKLLSYSKFNLDSCINRYNDKNELCIQYLFECKNLMKRIFLINHQNQHEFKCVFKLQAEFKEIISVLLKHNANLFLKTGQYTNAIDCLFDELKILIRGNQKKSASNLFCMQYLHDLLKDILKLSNPTHLRHDSSLLTKFFELLTVNEIYINEFDSTLRIVKMLAKFESAKSLSSNLVRKLLTFWISKPNYMNSNQSDKLNFIKTIFQILIAHNFNLNDTSLTFVNGRSESNNLLNILTKLLLNSTQVGYQAQCLYDLMIYLVQIGANPNVEPYELEVKTGNCRRPNYLLAQLCSVNIDISSIRRSSITNQSFANLSAFTTCSCSVSNTWNGKRESCTEFSNTHVYSPSLTTTNSSLLIRHYIKFLVFFYEFNDTKIICECLKYRDFNRSSSEALNVHLEKLCYNPRSLKSITRRCVNKIIQKPLISSVQKLPIPLRLQEFLLFNEIK